MLHNDPYVSTRSMIFIFRLLYSGKKIKTLRPCSASGKKNSFYLLCNKFKYNLVLRKSQLHVKRLLISRYVLLKQTFLTTLVMVKVTSYDRQTNYIKKNLKCITHNEFHFFLNTTCCILMYE